MQDNYKKLGEFIQQVSIKNIDLKVTKLLGVSITKKFIPSIANTIGTDMSKYKIVKKNQFTYGSITSRNGDKISVALLEDEEAIVSTSYTVFKVIDEDELLPEYLMMWFRRTEFDRYARYMSHGSTREAFGWDEMYNVELPIPSIEKQASIVKEYKTITDRITLNEKTNQKLEETAQAIYKSWFVDFEFPNEEGKPYKSSGGKMVFCEELDEEIPIGWEIITIKDYTVDMKNGGTPNRGISEYWNSNDIPWLKTGEIENNIIINTEEYISNKGFKSSSAKLFSKETVLMAMYGATAGQVAYLKFEITTNQACCGMICENVYLSTYLYYYLLTNQEEIAGMAIGGAQPNLSKALIEELKILKPTQNILESHPFNVIINNREMMTREIFELNKIKEILLSKMVTIEGF